MPVATVTYTGMIGPGLTLTTTVFRNVVSMKYDYVAETITIVFSDIGGPKEAIVSLSAVTTITSTVSSGVVSVTMS